MQYLKDYVNVDLISKDISKPSAIPREDPAASYFQIYFKTGF